MRIFLRWLRGPWVAPDPAPDWWGPACTCTTHAALRARDDLHATLRAEGTRYDVQWPDVLAAEAPGGDLAAMAAPGVGWTWTGSGGGGGVAAMAAPGDWPVFTGWGEYDIEREPVMVTIRADVSRFHGAMAQAQAATTAAAKPHGRHRQTGRGRHRQTALDLILADLRDLGGL